MSFSLTLCLCTVDCVFHCVYSLCTKVFGVRYETTLDFMPKKYTKMEEKKTDFQKDEKKTIYTKYGHIKRRLRVEDGKCIKRRPNCDCVIFVALELDTRTI